MRIDQQLLRTMASDPMRALEVGKAAEHIVCADAILRGYRCYLSDQGLPYDLLIDHGGTIIRVQVKASCFPKNINATGRSQRVAYSFHARRRGRGGLSRLGHKDCDLFALVALDIACVAYLPVFEVAQTVQLMPPGHEFRGNFVRTRVASVDGFPLHRAIDRLSRGAVGLRSDNEPTYTELDMIEVDGRFQSIREWGSEFGVSPKTISNRLRRGWSAVNAVSRAPCVKWSRKKGNIEGRQHG